MKNLVKIVARPDANQMLGAAGCLHERVAVTPGLTNRLTRTTVLQPPSQLQDYEVYCGDAGSPSGGKDRLMLEAGTLQGIHFSTTREPVLRSEPKMVSDDGVIDSWEFLWQRDLLVHPHVDQRKASAIHRHNDVVRSPVWVATE